MLVFSSTSVNAYFASYNSVIVDKLPVTLTHPASGQGLFGAAKAQLPTHHGGCSDVPVIVANGSPLSVLQHLHSTLTYHSPASQAH